MATNMSFVDSNTTLRNDSPCNLRSAAEPKYKRQEARQRSSIVSRTIPSVRFFGRSFELSEEEQQRQCEQAEKEYLPNLIRHCTFPSKRLRGWKEIKKADGLTVWEKGSQKKASMHIQASSYQVRGSTRVHSSLEVLVEILGSTALQSYRSYLRILYNRLITGTTILSHYDRPGDTTNANATSNQVSGCGASLRLCWMAYNSPIPMATGLEVLLTTYTKKLAPDALGPIGSMNQKQERSNNPGAQEIAPAAFQISWTSKSKLFPGISDLDSPFIHLAGFLLYRTNHQEMTDIVFYASTGEQKDVFRQNAIKFILRKMACSIGRFANAVNAWKWNQRIQAKLHAARQIWSRADSYLQCGSCFCLFGEFVQRKRQCFICSEIFCWSCSTSGVVDLPATGITNVAICKTCQRIHCGTQGGKLPFYSKNGQSKATSVIQEKEQKEPMKKPQPEATSPIQIFKNKSFQRSQTSAAFRKSKINEPGESKMSTATPPAEINLFSSVSGGVSISKLQARLRTEIARSPGRFVASTQNSLREASEKYVNLNSAKDANPTRSLQWNTEHLTRIPSNQRDDSLQHLRLVPSFEVFMSSLKALCLHATEALKCKYGAVSIVQFDQTPIGISSSYSHYLHVRKQNRLIPISEKMACCLPILKSRSAVLYHDVRDTSQSPRQDFLQSPLVKGPQAVRFYAGVPLNFQQIGSDEVFLGALSVFDPVPRRGSTRKDPKCAILQHLVDTFMKKNLMVLNSPLLSHRRGSSSDIQTETTCQVDSSHGKKLCTVTPKAKAQPKICKGDFTAMTLDSKRQQEYVL
uniref:AlNc14C11G1340 protein n=1 Tax=Albugo laibachii Nc14 TaxID=890382 RepID=F0W2W2_9STRA|nr:AlNc14C11G1340 [Albugo laibachii Nc14]|eukprot:CCA15398.1 AlNc14C11G1340 [Albugo laibachii Nc14]